MKRDPLAALSGLAALKEISARLGGLGMEVKSALDKVQQAGMGADQGARSHVTEHHFSIPTANGKSDGVAQMSFRVGSLADRPGAARSGGRNTASSSAAQRAERPRRAASPDVDGAREPLVDCFDEGDTVLVTAEMPGVGAADIRLSIDGGDLLIETTGERRYRARQSLPADVDPSSLDHALRNGILEARLKKMKTGVPS